MRVRVGGSHRKEAIAIAFNLDMFNSSSRAYCHRWWLQIVYLRVIVRHRKEALPIAFNEGLSDLSGDAHCYCWWLPIVYLRVIASHRKGALAIAFDIDLIDLSGDPPCYRWWLPIVYLRATASTERNRSPRPERWQNAIHRVIAVIKDAWWICVIFGSASFMTRKREGNPTLLFLSRVSAKVHDNAVKTTRSVIAASACQEQFTAFFHRRRIRLSSTEFALQARFRWRRVLPHS